MEKEFKVWCKDKNEWEKEYCSLGQDGELYHWGNSSILAIDKTAHIIVFFTGFYDKTGKKIYEGDIVVDWNTGVKDESSSPYVISYEESWTVESLHPDQFPMVEIIGNIYENPELLPKEGE
jgi:hypothetical protein